MKTAYLSMTLEKSRPNVDLRKKTSCFFSEPFSNKITWNSEITNRDAHVLESPELDEIFVAEADEPEIFIPIIQGLTNSVENDVIITTGGTGLTGRDNTIDALKKISQIEIPGFGELFRQLSYQKIGTSTIQSRASAFLLNQTYIFCLPGSTSAVRDAWNDILFHQLDIRHKPCNFIELIPRLDE